VHDPASWFRKTWFTRRRVWELKNAHNSVTVQNRIHVYMNFFHHKDLGNHLLQLCPKVVKHPVFNYDRAASPATGRLPTIIFLVAYKPFRRRGFLGPWSVQVNEYCFTLISSVFRALITCIKRIKDQQMDFNLIVLSSPTCFGQSYGHLQGDSLHNENTAVIRRCLNHSTVCNFWLKFIDEK